MDVCLGVLLPELFATPLRHKCGGFCKCFVGLMPGWERQSPQEKRVSAEIPCLATGLGERAAFEREGERERERERDGERVRV